MILLLDTRWMAFFVRMTDNMSNVLLVCICCLQASGDSYNPGGVSFLAQAQATSASSASSAAAAAAATSTSKVALIVDGTSLESLWSRPDLKEKFTAAVRSVPTVIACRVRGLG
jgi:hypothetical protein